MKTETNENKIINPADLSFEEALGRLEEIVKGLESGSAPLDKSLELFEEGVGLVRECNKKLDGARQKITMLSANGEISDVKEQENG